MNLSGGNYDITTSRDEFSCKHIAEYKKDPDLNCYSFVHGLFVSCVTQNSFNIKARDCKCSEESCKSKYKRLHGCLYCFFFGCHGDHIKKHFEDYNHPLAIDINSGHVYCFECKDYKYDNDFEEIAEKQKMIASIQRSDITNYKYAPTIKQEELLSKLYPYGEDNSLSSQDKIKGLRGILNMGYTCYITVILQSLLHAPVIRDYFLSNKHTESCAVPQPSNSLVTDYSSVCFSCEIGKIVQEFYSGKDEVYIPYEFLFLIWKNVPCLAGERMQDPYEFLLELLNLLHKHCKITNPEQYNAKHHATCIMENFFAGVSRSESICQTCKSEISHNTTFYDISLNLDLKVHAKSSGENEISKAVSLQDYLKRLTELKDLNHKPTCVKCKVTRQCKEKMEFRELPVIMIFHVNRLSIDGKNEHYNDGFIQFPEDLDMTPFVSYCKNGYNPKNVNYNKEYIKEVFSISISNNKIGTLIFYFVFEDGPWRFQNGFTVEQHFWFYLFAVVQYKYGTNLKISKMAAGHYVCYVRMHDKKWYYCDDTDVVSTSFQEVKEIPAYLLFYQKEHLEYNVENILKEQFKDS